MEKSLKVFHKIILGLCMAFLLCPLFLFGTILYYYLHPSTTKTVLEKTVCRSTGFSFCIDDLSYSLYPFTINAKGIIFGQKDAPGIQLKISEMAAQVSLGGPWGNRSLVLDRLRIDGYALNFQQIEDAKKGPSETKGDASIPNMIERLIPLLLFRSFECRDMQLINGDLTVSMQDRTFHITELEQVKSSFHFSSRFPNYFLKDLSLSIPHLKMVSGDKAVPINDMGFQIQELAYDSKMKSLSIPEMTFNSSWLRNLVLTLKYDPERLSLRLNGERTDLLVPAKALGLLPDGFEFKGPDALQVQISRDTSEDLSYSSRLDLKGLGFQNSDGSIIGEKLSLSATVNADMNDTSVITAETLLRADSGEILFDRFYLDLKTNPFLSSLKCKFNTDKGAVALSKSVLQFKDILRLDLDGMIRFKGNRKIFNVFLGMPETDIQSPFRNLVLEPFKMEKPFLKSLDLDGTVSGNLRLASNGSHHTMIGRFRWNNGNLSLNNDALSFKGIHLDLPVWYETEKNTIAKNSLKGKLSIQSMNLPLVPEQSLKLQLDAGRNRLAIHSTTVIDVPGGNIEISPITANHIFSEPLISTGITIDAVALDPFLSKIFPNPIKGRINGELAPISFEKGNLNTQGEIAARVSGGQIILSDLGASGIFSSAPLFALNAQLKDLSLDKFTTGTSFGRIEGILEGHIKNLEIAYGQPQSFDLLLQTVDKRGVPQRISVAAVDNISRIGGGQSAFMGLAGSFASLFSEFPYKKIGIRASLRNDVFRLNGTIREGNKEYIVKRGLFSGVNIVNQNPDNRISFKDMVKRIKRINAKGSKPVIK